MYFLVQDVFNGYFRFILIILAMLAIALAILVITLKNPISSVLSLIGLFIVIGSYLGLIGITFVGLAYLLVYVGAVSMLFLFVLMLINIRISELVNNTKNSIPLVFLVAIIFAVGDDVVLPQLQNSIEAQVTSLINWEIITNFEHITSIGIIMYSNFAIYMFLICLILLIAMVGAIVINISPKTSNFNLPHNVILKSSCLVSLNVLNMVATDFSTDYDYFNGIFTLSAEYPNLIGENGRLPDVHAWIRSEVGYAIRLYDQGLGDWPDNPSWDSKRGIANVSRELLNNVSVCIEKILDWDLRLITLNENLSPLTDHELRRAGILARANIPFVVYAQEKIIVLQEQLNYHRIFETSSTSRILALTMDSQGHFIRR